MTESTLRLNPEASHRIFTVGNEKTTVYVIDDVLMDLSPILNDAATAAAFSSEISTYYPGVRAHLPRGYAEAMITAVRGILHNSFDAPTDASLHVKAGYYSLVSHAPEDLHPLQQIPHFDSSNRFYFAIMHYLNPGDFGGTSFYRHKATGFENITNENKASYINEAEQLAATKQHNGSQGYFLDSDAYFERLGSISYRQNRLVIYPGSLLHSGNISSAKDIDDNPNTGRLTANLFVDFV